MRRPASLAASLQSAAADGRAQVVDVSANRTVVEVSGPAAREVLEKGCPTDLHPRAFADNTAITTSLARVPVLLWKIDAHTFRVMPRASLAQYVAAWLLDASRSSPPRRLPASAGSLMALSAFDLYSVGIGPSSLAHGRSDARGEAVRRGRSRSRAGSATYDVCAPSCSARSVPPATATARRRLCVLGLEGEDPATTDTDRADGRIERGPERR